MSGAFVLLHSLDPETILDCRDMPTIKQRVGKTDRPRLDFEGLDRLIADMTGDRPLVVVEDVGTRPRQSGTMAFGRSVGALEHAFHAAKLRVEHIVPTKWKPALKAPKDKKESVARADQLFPLHRSLFRGPKGGTLDGRAEAAMLALYGARYLQ
jgi:hypothetical protein